jgi:hypothetical protein
VLDKQSMITSADSLFVARESHVPTSALVIIDCLSNTYYLPATINNNFIQQVLLLRL